MIAPIGHRDAFRRTLIAPDAVVPATVLEDVLLLVDLRMQPRQVRVELVDPAPGVSPGGSRARGKAGRWGRFLVEQLADRWGVSRAGPGTCVWCEIEFER